MKVYAKNQVGRSIKVNFTKSTTYGEDQERLLDTFFLFSTLTPFLGEIVKTSLIKPLGYFTYT